MTEEQYIEIKTLLIEIKGLLYSIEWNTRNKDEI